MTNTYCSLLLVVLLLAVSQDVATAGCSTTSITRNGTVTVGGHSVRCMISTLFCLGSCDASIWYEPHTFDPVGTEDPKSHCSVDVKQCAAKTVSWTTVNAVDSSCWYTVNGVEQSATTLIQQNDPTLTISYNEPTLCECTDYTSAIFPTGSTFTTEDTCAGKFVVSFTTAYNV